MAENSAPEKFQVDELDDSALDGVSGGVTEPTNNGCTVNSGNCVAGCACGSTIGPPE
jgi:hypothetical protein